MFPLLTSYNKFAERLMEKPLNVLIRRAAYRGYTRSCTKRSYYPAMAFASSGAETGSPPGNGPILFPDEQQDLPFGLTYVAMIWTTLWGTRYHSCFRLYAISRRVADFHLDAVICQPHYGITALVLITRKLPAAKAQPTRKTDKLTTVSRLSRKCVIPNLSHPYRTPPASKGID